MDKSDNVNSSCENELTSGTHYVLIPVMPVIEKYCQLIEGRSGKVGKYMLHKALKAQKRKARVAFKKCQSCERLAKQLDIGHDITS